VFDGRILSCAALLLMLRHAAHMVKIPGICTNKTISISMNGYKYTQTKYNAKTISISINGYKCTQTKSPKEYKADNKQNFMHKSYL
jgi:hypothetical protein